MTQFVFLGSMGRSGTNLLRNALDCHPDIASGPEFNHIEDIVFMHRTLSRSIRNGRLSTYMSSSDLESYTRTYITAALEPYAKRRNRKILVEKTPSNLWCFDKLAKLFPDAKFIHMIRDGRDVCCSHREVGKRMLERGEQLDTATDAALTSIFHCAALWTETIRFGLRISGPDSELAKEGRIITVRYEDLATAPERELRRVCELLEVPFAPAMLHPELVEHDTFIDDIWVKAEDQTRPISTSAVGRWRKQLSLKSRVLFAASGQEGLVDAGYEENMQWTLADITLPPDQAQIEVTEARQEIEIYKSMTFSNRPRPLG